MKGLFLSVGAMKAGTTFLYNALQQHPGLYFTPEKEIHFLAHLYGFEPGMTNPLFSNAAGRSWCGMWPEKILTSEYRIFRLGQVIKNRYCNVSDPDRLREIVRWYSEKYLPGEVDIAWCHNIFTGCGQDQWACEFSNYNAVLSQSGAEFARSYFPAVKVLFMLRHPVARIWSHIKFDLQFNGKEVSSSSLPASEIMDYAATGHFSAYSRYGDIVEHLQSSFGEENVMVICMENFLSDFWSTMKQLENFLEVDHFSYQVDLGRKANPSKGVELDAAIAGFLRDQALVQVDKLRALGINLPSHYYETHVERGNLK